MRVAKTNQRRYKPLCQGVQEAQGHQLVPSHPVGKTDMAGLTLQALSWRSSQKMSCSSFQTFFPFPGGFYFRHRQHIVQQYLLRMVNVFSCPFGYLCTSLPFLSKGR